MPLSDPVGQLPYRLELDQVIGPERADAISRDGGQRFSRRVDGHAVPHVVAGAGGYHELHPLGRGIGPVPMSLHGVDGLADVTLEDYEDRAHGFLTVTVEPGTAEFVYHAVTPGTVYARDAFTIRASASR